MIEFNSQTRCLSLFYKVVLSDNTIAEEKRTSIDLSGIDEETVQLVIRVAKVVHSFDCLQKQALEQITQINKEGKKVIQPSLVSTVTDFKQRLIAKRSSSNLKSQQTQAVTPAPTV